MVTGCFTVRTSIFNRELNLFVTDSNPEIKKHRNKETGEKESCFVSRKFRFNVDTGTPLPTDICRPEPCPPPPCPPDPCREDEYERDEHEDIFAGRDYTQADGSATIVATKQSPKGNFELRDEDVMVYGFNTLGGINRAEDALLTYHFKIPLHQIPAGYSLLQLYLEDDTGLNTLLLSKGIQNITDGNDLPADETDLKKLKDALSYMGNDVEVIKKDLTDLRNQVNKITEADKGQSEAAQKSSPKGKQGG